MPKHPPFRLYLAGPARGDIAAIDRYTLGTFGEAAADRYDTLIRQALRDLLEDPDRPGVRTCPDVLNAAVRLYHLSSSRDRVTGERVKESRHFIVYRVRPDDTIEVLRVLHDSRDLARHLPGA